MTTHQPTCLPTAFCGGVRAVGPWMPASRRSRPSRRPRRGIVGVRH